MPMVCAGSVGSAGLDGRGVSGGVGWVWTLGPTGLCWARWAAGVWWCGPGWPERQLLELLSVLPAAHGPLESGAVAVLSAEAVSRGGPGPTHAA